MEEVLRLAGASGGVGMVLAILVVRWQREDGKERADRCRECCEREVKAREDERSDKRLMIEVIQGNTRALTEVVEAVRSAGGGSTRGGSGRLAAVGRGPGGAEQEGGSGGVR